MGEAQQQLSAVLFKMHTSTEEEQKMLKTYALEHFLAITLTPTPEEQKTMKNFAVNQEEMLANFAVG